MSWTREKCFSLSTIREGLVLIWILLVACSILVIIRTDPSLASLSDFASSLTSKFSKDKVSRLILLVYTLQACMFFFVTTLDGVVEALVSLIAAISILISYLRSPC